MSGDSSQHISPSARQSEVEGWMVLSVYFYLCPIVGAVSSDNDALVPSPTHDSIESDESAGDTTTKKRKFTNSSISPRLTKSPRVSVSDILAKSTRPLASGSEKRYSLGTKSASQPIFTRTGNANGDSLVLDGESRGSIASSGITRVIDRLSGASAVPRPIQRSTISDSETDAYGNGLQMDKQKVPGTKSIIQSTSAVDSSSLALDIRGSSSWLTRKATARDYNRGTSSDGLPDPSEIMRSLSSPTTKLQQEGTNTKGKGKETAKRMFNNGITCDWFMIVRFPC